MCGLEARLFFLTCLIGLLASAPASADPAYTKDERGSDTQAELAEMRATLSEQARQLELLDDELRMLRDQQAHAAERGGIGFADVDRRIEQFETQPTSKMFISGYGAAGYTDSQAGDSTFGMQLVPIIHYQVSDRLHLIGELEFDLRDEHSDVKLEYAQIDFLLNDYVTMTMGKFLVPFNAFSERIHPAWINKLPSPPPIYGHHGMGGGIVPILSDTGFQFRGGFRLPWSIDERGSRLNYAFYAVNGPSMGHHDETDEKLEELAEFLEDEGVILAADDLLDALGIEEPEAEPAFGENFRDNNRNKSLGGRIGFLPIPSLEFGASMLGGRYDDEGDLSFRLQGVDAAYRRGPFDLRGEFLTLSFDNDSGGTERKNGFYVQAAYSLRDLAYGLGLSSQSPIARTEFVARYGAVDDGQDFRETTLGLDYWLTPSVPLKIAYSFRDEEGDELDNDRFQLQLAYGF